jgi:co-chaperonin GroES (HSP10)
MTLIAAGSRILVEDIAPVDEITERAKRAGLTAVVYNHNVPKPTTGRVVAIGQDPLFKDMGLELGDIVFFSRHAGTLVQNEGKSYRSLESHEIISVKKEKA